MKHCIKIALFLYLSLFLVSCGANGKNTEEIPAAQKKPSVTINAYYDEPASYSDENSIIWGDVLKNEYVEVIIQGKVIDFEYLHVDYDDKTKEFVENGLKGKYSTLENKTVVIRTDLPEGIPSEKLKWKNEQGKEFEYIIRDYGLAEQKDTQQIFPLD